MIDCTKIISSLHILFYKKINIKKFLGILSQTDYQIKLALMT